MFRKISLKIVLAAFLVILVIAGLVEIIDLKKGDRTFKGDLIEVNPEDVTEIQVFPEVLKQVLVRFFKENGKWVIEFKGKKYNTIESLPGSMIIELNDLKAESVVATKKESWDQYKVTDSLSTRVRLLNNSKIISDLLIGKFEFDQSQKTRTFVRLAGEQEVYSINGLLAMVFNCDLNTFRDPTIFKKGSSDLSRLTFSYPADSSFTLVRTGGKWIIKGTPADSAKVAGYLSGLSELNNHDFTDFIPQGPPSHSLLIEGNNIVAPIKIDGYLQQDGSIVIESSQNKGTFFKSKELSDKIFVSRNKF